MEKGKKPTKPSFLNLNPFRSRKEKEASKDRSNQRLKSLNKKHENQIQKQLKSDQKTRQKELKLEYEKQQRFKTLYEFDSDDDDDDSGSLDEDSVNSFQSVNEGNKTDGVYDSLLGPGYNIAAGFEDKRDGGKMMGTNSSPRSSQRSIATRKVSNVSQEKDSIPANHTTTTAGQIKDAISSMVDYIDHHTENVVYFFSGFILLLLLYVTQDTTSLSHDNNTILQPILFTFLFLTQTILFLQTTNQCIQTVQDFKTNLVICRCITINKTIEYLKLSSAIPAGSILLVKKNEVIPCNMIILSSSNNLNSAYIASKINGTTSSSSSSDTNLSKLVIRSTALLSKSKKKSLKDKINDIFFVGYIVDADDCTTILHKIYNYLFNTDDDQMNKLIVVHIDEPNSRQSTFQPNKHYSPIMTNNYTTTTPFRERMSSMVTSSNPTKTNDLFTTFTGFLTCETNVISLSTEHFLPQGYILKNTNWILGAFLNYDATEKDDIDMSSSMFLLMVSYVIIIYLVMTFSMYLLFVLILYLNENVDLNAWYLGYNATSWPYLSQYLKDIAYNLAEDEANASPEVRAYNVSEDRAYDLPTLEETSIQVEAQQVYNHSKNSISNETIQKASSSSNYTINIIFLISILLICNNCLNISIKDITDQLNNILIKLYNYCYNILPKSTTLYNTTTRFANNMNNLISKLYNSDYPTTLAKDINAFIAKSIATIHHYAICIKNILNACIQKVKHYTVMLSKQANDAYTKRKQERGTVLQMIAMFLLCKIVFLQILFAFVLEYVLLAPKACFEMIQSRMYNNVIDTNIEDIREEEDTISTDAVMNDSKLVDLSVSLTYFDADDDFDKDVQEKVIVGYYNDAQEEALDEQSDDDCDSSMNDVTSHVSNKVCDDYQSYDVPQTYYANSNNNSKEDCDDCYQDDIQQTYKDTHNSNAVTSKTNDSDLVNEDSDSTSSYDVVTKVKYYFEEDDDSSQYDCYSTSEDSYEINERTKVEALDDETPFEGLDVKQVNEYQENRLAPNLVLESNDSIDATIEENVCSNYEEMDQRESIKKDPQIQPLNMELSIEPEPVPEHENSNDLEPTLDSSDIIPIKQEEGPIMNQDNIGCEDQIRKDIDHILRPEECKDSDSIVSSGTTPELIKQEDNASDFGNLESTNDSSSSSSSSSLIDSTNYGNSITKVGFYFEETEDDDHSSYYHMTSDTSSFSSDDIDNGIGNESLPKEENNLLVPMKIEVPISDTNDYNENIVFAPQDFPMSAISIEQQKHKHLDDDEPNDININSDYSNNPYENDSNVTFDDDSFDDYPEINEKSQIQQKLHYSDDKIINRDGTIDTSKETKFTATTISDNDQNDGSNNYEDNSCDRSEDYNHLTVESSSTSIMDQNDYIDDDKDGVNYSSDSDVSDVVCESDHEECSNNSDDNIDENSSYVSEDDEDQDDYYSSDCNISSSSNVACEAIQYFNYVDDETKANERSSVNGSYYINDAFTFFKE